MKFILTAFAIGAGLFLAFTGYALITGATTFTPQLALLSLGLFIVFVACIALVRQAA